MSKKIEIKGLICLLLPLAIVFFMFITNAIGSMNSEELKFKVTLYDPFDVIRGKYLDITLEEREVIIPELLGRYANENNYQNKFISTYKSLSESDKKYVQKYVNETLDEIENMNKNLGSADSVNSYRIDDNLISFANDLICSINSGFVRNTDYNFEDDIIRVALIARKNNLDFFEIIESVNPTLVETDEYRDFHRDIENRQYYVYYDVDEDGYAVFDQISSTKIKGKKNYMKDSINISYNSGDLIWYASIDGTGKEFYMDERLAKTAEYAVRDAINEDKEVVIVAKLANGNMLIEKLLVDNKDIYDYLEEYQEKQENKRIIEITES